MYGAADVALCLAGEEGTVEVVWGIHTTRAYFDQPGAVVLGGELMATDYTITLGAAALPGIKTGADLTVDGVSYRVREARLLDDGVLMRAELKKT